jgi:hypothetical protein
MGVDESRRASNGFCPPVLPSRLKAFADKQPYIHIIRAARYAK